MLSPMPVTRSSEGLRARLEALVSALGSRRDDWRIDEWEAEQGITLTLRSGSRALVGELEAADLTRPCFATTRLFNVYYRRRGEDRRDLMADERDVLDSLVAALRREEEGLVVVPPRAETTGSVQVRELEVSRALVREGPGAYYLNPYVGCLLACPFCYAQHRADFSRSLEGLSPQPWGRWLDVKVNAPEVLAEEVRRLPPGLVRMSPIITDPYQPIERRYRVTRRCLEVLAGSDFTPVVLTRASSVLEDIELLRRCRGAVVGMSVPTDDDAVRTAFEPATEPIEERLETLRALKEAGLRTFGVIQPMLPMTPERLAEKLAPHVDAVRIGPLYEKLRVAKALATVGRREFLDEAWERATYEALKRALEARGVPVNPEGPAWSFLA